MLLELPHRSADEFAGEAAPIIRARHQGRLQDKLVIG
jgi:hypothetical protein